MPARDPSTGLVLRPSLPPLTTTCYLYPVYGQSNSDGTNGLMPVGVSDPTYGAAGFFGRDGLGSRDGTTAPTSWVDKTYPPALIDYSALPNNTIDEPFRVYQKESLMNQVGAVLNARQIKATGQRHFCRFASFGQTGYTIAQLSKGTNTYTNFIAGVTKMVACATAQGYTPIINAVPYVQGEADFAPYGSGSGYAASLATLQANIEADLKAITGQSQAIPMFIFQQSNFGCNYASGIAYPLLEELAAHIANPGKIILVGGYYAGETDGGDGAGAFNLHFRGTHESRWAAGGGNIMADVLIDGKTGNPVRPKTPTRIGNVVTMPFWVPAPPLVLDTGYVTNLLDGNYGFDFHQTGGSAITITSVVQSAVDTLVYTLSAAPDGTSPFIRGGANLAGAVVSVSGFRTGPRTCLRDSADPDQRFCNYCIHFDQPIP